MFGTFLVSGLVTASILVLVVAAMVVAAVAALFQFCADLGHTHEGHQSTAKRSR